MNLLHFSKISFIGLLFNFCAQQLSAQISGTVFADYNASGTRTTTNPAEPLLSGVIVTAYNAAGTILASYTTTHGNATSATYPYTAPNFSIPASGTAYNGTLGSNTGFVASGTGVRLEFTLSATGCTADNTLYSGQGSSSVQFITAPSSTVLYGINNPVDYNTGTTGVSLFTPCYVSGNPLGGGAAGTADWFVGFPYTNSGNTTAPAQKLAGSQIGAVWGEAYSKQAQKIFTSAFLKRHSGYGPMGSGGIYLLTPTASSFTVVQFFDMDNNTFNTAANPVTRTRADGTAPAYGNGSSFTLSNSNRAVTFNGSTDPVSGFPSGLGVIGTNVQRGLPAAGGDSYDGAAFDQVGKVGIGDIEISDDGKYLFVMNLYQRRVFRLELNDAYNPTSVVSVTGYDLPAQSCTNGVLRPFATKFYKGKLYVGAVCTGENETTNTNANLSAQIFELNNATSTASFNTTTVLNYPLTYTKGLTSSTSDSSGTRWYPWVNDVDKTRRQPITNTAILWLPQPILSDIEFTDKGDMLMSFMDRIGHQVGNFTYYYLGGSSTALTQTEISGDILIAGRNCPSGFTLENNGSYTSNGVAYSSGTANGQGPGGGEFFRNDQSTGGGFSPYAHLENNMGAMAVLAGSNAVKTIIMDPLRASSGGLITYNTTNAAASGAYELYYSVASNTLGKANGLGDLELNTALAPLEIGNRVWLDTDKDGVQDAGESGIGSVQIQLFADFDNNGSPDGAALATTTTSTTAGNALGTWFFNTTNVTDGDPSVAGNQAGPQPNKRYLIRIGASTWAAGAGTGALANLFLTTANTGAASQPDLTDNDAALAASIPTISYLTGVAGQNDHTLDLGFITCPTITNPSSAQTICVGTTGSNITVNTDYNAPNGIRFVRFTSDQMAGSSPTTTEATNIYAGTALTTVTPTGASSPYTATYTFNTADFPNATTSPIIYYVYAILNPDLGATCRPVQEIAIMVNPKPSFTLTQTAPTCSSGTAQNNGKITLTAATNANKYGVSTGATYTGTPAYAAATAISTLPQDVQTAIPNTGGTYTIRLFNGTDACSTDQTVTIQPVSCCPYPNCGTMTVIKN